MNYEEFERMIDECVKAGLVEIDIDPETEQLLYRPTEFGLRIAGEDNE